MDTLLRFEGNKALYEGIFINTFVKLTKVGE